MAAAARAQGITIYCIGLIGSDGLDIDALNNWATDPDASHVVVTPDLSELEDLFEDLAANITKPGATNIQIREMVTPDFVITSILPPAKGTAVQLDDHSLRWNIPELGVTLSESAVLEFFIRHVGQDPGIKLVNESITYSDNEGNVVTFPEPTVEVECDVVVHPEECPVPICFVVDGCEDSMMVDLDDTYLESQGRIIQVNATVKQVCPHTRVALAVILTEVNPDGMEYQRGMKAMTLPAHDFPGCRDIQVKCIKFVVPEDLSVSGGAMCSSRSFRARLIAHSIDTDYRCCEAVVSP